MKHAQAALVALERAVDKEELASSSTKAAEAAGTGTTTATTTTATASSLEAALAAVAAAEAAAGEEPLFHRDRQGARRRAQGPAGSRASDAEAVGCLECGERERGGVGESRGNCKQKGLLFTRKQKRKNASSCNGENRMKTKE